MVTTINDALLCVNCGQQSISATCPHETHRGHLDIRWERSENVVKGGYFIHTLSYPFTSRIFPAHCFGCCDNRREVR